jgi:hypothetical protein
MKPTTAWFALWRDALAAANPDSDLRSAIMDAITGLVGLTFSMEAA